MCILCTVCIYLYKCVRTPACKVYSDLPTIFDSLKENMTELKFSFLRSHFTTCTELLRDVGAQCISCILNAVLYIRRACAQIYQYCRYIVLNSLTLYLIIWYWFLLCIVGFNFFRQVTGLLICPSFWIG